MTKSYYALVAEMREIEDELRDARRTVEWWMKRYEQVLKDAARYQWLKRQDPLGLCAIAYRAKEACAVHSGNPDECVDVAMATYQQNERTEEPGDDREAMPAR